MTGQHERMRRSSVRQEPDSQAAQQAWCEFAARHSVGTPVRGVVRQAKPVGAFIQIDRFVSGFVPHEEIAQIPTDNVSELLWTGDIVEGVITHIDEREKRVVLSMRQLQAQRIGQVGSALPESEREIPAIEEPGAVRYVASAPETEKWPIGSIFAAAYSHRALSDKLLTILQAVCQETRSDKAFLLRYEPTTNAVFLVAGTASLDTCNALLYSGVRDVYEGRTLVANETSGSYALTRLLALLEAKTLIGMPVKVGNRTNHALLLCGQPTSEDPSALMPAVVCASLLGQSLTLAACEEVLHRSSFMIRLGQLTGMFLHEARNLFGDMGVTLRNLQYDIVSENERAGVSYADMQTARIKRRVERAIGITEQTGRLMEQWFSLLRRGDERLLTCNEILNDVIEMLRPQARHDRVMIDLEVSNDVTRAAIVPRALRHVLVDVVLHSIGDVTFDQGHVRNALGKVVIAAGYDSQSRELKIRVMNNGLGIHRRYWDAIFEAGFSTRVSDPGLGLYIARVITESLGGRLCVEDSIILGGTTFLLSVPIETTSQRTDLE